MLASEDVHLRALQTMTEQFQLCVFLENCIVVRNNVWVMECT
jgi:hypothetical protein